MSDDELGADLQYVGRRVRATFPKTYSARQGRRKKDRWGPCSSCGHPGAFRCHTCSKWRCWQCIRLRRMADSIGVYFVRCAPRCVHRRKPDVIAVVTKFTRGGGSPLLKPKS